MKLQTSIPARRDGTVRHTGQDRQTYVFAPGSDGELTCDVIDEEEVAKLLATGMFWPANPDDFDSALRLTKPASNVDTGGVGDDGDEEENEDDGDSLAVLPVEANTPPSPARKKPGPKPKAN